MDCAGYSLSWCKHKFNPSEIIWGGRFEGVLCVCGNVPDTLKCSVYREVIREDAFTARYSP